MVRQSGVELHKTLSHARLFEGRFPVIVLQHHCSSPFKDSYQGPSTFGEGESAGRCV